MDNNFLYAVAPSGKTVKIPLTGGPLDYSEIGQRLVSAGIPLVNIPNVAFTLDKPLAPRGLTIEERAEIASQVIALPPFPPPNDNKMLPGFSEISRETEISLRAAKKQTGRGYYMEKGPGEFIDVMSLPEKEFFDPDDYKMLHDTDSVKFVYGKVWRLADQQNISPGITEYNRTSVFRAGMTEKTTLEIEASLGYQGYGVSVSLRLLFRREITVDKESEETEHFVFNGKPGVVIVFGLWQECDIFLIEKDGVRQNDPSFSLILQDKHKTPYEVIDRFDGSLNPLTRDQAEVVEIAI